MTDETKSAKQTKTKFTKTQNITLHFPDIQTSSIEYPLLIITHAGGVEELTLPRAHAEKLLANLNSKTHEDALVLFFHEHYRRYEKSSTCVGLITKNPSFQTKLLKAVKQSYTPIPPPKKLTPAKLQKAKEIANKNDQKAIAPFEAVPLSVVDNAFAFGTDLYGTQSQSQPLSQTPPDSQSPKDIERSSGPALARSASGKTSSKPLTRSQSRPQFPAAAAASSPMAGSKADEEMGTGNLSLATSTPASSQLRRSAVAPFNLLTTPKESSTARSSAADNSTSTAADTSRQSRRSSSSSASSKAGFFAGGRGGSSKMVMDDKHAAVPAKASQQSSTSGATLTAFFPTEEPSAKRQKGDAGKPVAASSSAGSGSGSSAKGSKETTLSNKESSRKRKR